MASIVVMCLDLLVIDYLERMAATGSILAACDAGMIPAKIPTVIQMMMVVASMVAEI